jgi:methylenetetrahydrofolate reductase (NADPH)
MRFDRMGSLGPLFIDVTWGAGGARPGAHNISLEIAAAAQNICCLDTNLHLTCNTSTREQLIDILNECKRVGIRNILALRGDPPKYEPEKAPEFNFATDLVRLMREEYGDWFGISVAGYPYKHPDAASYEEGIQHLKQKVDAGSDFIISQLFFTSKDFFDWEKDCRAAGITCPIIPGILPIQGYDSLRNMSKMCCLDLPAEIVEAVEPIKHDDAAIKAFGVEYATKLCQELLEGGVPGLHFYTLNREVVTEKILANLGFGTVQTPVATEGGRALPWKKPPTDKRSKEDVRPIFWANRHKTYLARTAEWDDFPNGRWGDSRSPAFGELTDYHLFLHQKTLKPAECRALWGETISEPKDCGKAFVRFLNREIDRLPWIDTELNLETGPIKDGLIRLNEAGFWTINSQPRVNGADSSDAAVGWGGAGGIVYQKAYIEFFTSPQLLKVLLRVLNRFGSRVNYQAVNKSSVCYSNTDRTIAVTWGVFPGREICQPTIVDPASFFVWKDEAFALWTAAWANAYSHDSISYRNIMEIHDTYFLVNVVDNDFTKGNIFEIFDLVQEELKNGDVNSFTPIRPMSPSSSVIVESQQQILNHPDDHQ